MTRENELCLRCVTDSLPCAARTVARRLEAREKAGDKDWRNPFRLEGLREGVQQPVENAPCAHCRHRAMLEAALS